LSGGFEAEGERMRNLLLWLWQLPQHLLGVLLIFFVVGERREIAGITYWHFGRWDWFTRVFAGVSLGRYILLPDMRDLKTTARHEWGHSLQSHLFGPLYLFIIGLPSISGNIWDRLFHRGWDGRRRYRWYYSLPWERDADRRAGVVRWFHEEAR